MWERVLEWCAEIFGVSVESKLGQLVGYSLVLFALGLFFMSRWGVEGWWVPAILVAFSAAVARQVTAARDALWRAAGLPLDARRQRPPHWVSVKGMAPTAASLRRLADAVDHVRRGDYAAAQEALPGVERVLLRPEESQLLDAVQAMISMGTGSRERAAQQAAAALPSGSDDLDASLGRTLVASAWRTPERLSAIHDAWTRAGLTAGPLSRLGSLVRIRIDPERMNELSTPEARDLSDEARAIGDDELAAELDARSKTAYR